MKKDDLLEALKSPAMKMTLQEIQEMMDHELNKDPDEMDAEIVDICAHILHRELIDTGKTTGKRGKALRSRPKTAKRILLIAAILFVVFSIAVPVYARYVRNDMTDGIVRFIENHFRFDLRKGLSDPSPSTSPPMDLVSELQNMGVEDVILPKALLSSDDYSIGRIYDRIVDGYKNITVEFKSSNTNTYGFVYIKAFNNLDVQRLYQQGNIEKNYDNVEHLMIKSLDILVFGSNNESVILYTNNNLNYTIILKNCDFETAVSIGKTLE